MRKIFLSGGWGYGNLGDNVILDVTLRELRRVFDKAELCLSAYSSDEIKRLHKLDSVPSVHRLMGFRTLSRRRYHLDSVWNKIAAAVWRATGVWLPSGLQRHARLIAECDLVVLAGGGYLNDAWASMKKAQLFEIELAKRLGKPIAITGQTVGPFKDPEGDTNLSERLKQVDIICCRDAGSQSYVNDFVSGDPGCCVRTADVANLLPAPNPKVSPGERIAMGVMVQNFRGHDGKDGPGGTGAISSSAEYVDAIVDALRRLAEVTPATFKFLASTSWDLSFATAVARALRAKGVSNVEEPRAFSLEEFIQTCQSVDVMLSTNMHPVIIAATAGKPSVALSYSFKLDDYMDDVGMSFMIFKINDFSADGLFEKLQTLVADRVRLGELVDREMPKMRALASLNFDSLKRLD